MGCAFDCKKELLGVRWYNQNKYYAAGANRHDHTGQADQP